MKPSVDQLIPTVDFILVYKPKIDDDHVTNLSSEDSIDLDFSNNKRMFDKPDETPGEYDISQEKQTKFRLQFIENLTELGLNVFATEAQGGLVFYTIHIPFGVMKKYAEVLQMNMPILESLEIMGKGPFSHFCDRLYSTRDYDRRLVPDIPYMLTMRFTKSNENFFLIDENAQDVFFSQSQRDMVIQFLLSETEFDDVGDRLLNRKGLLMLQYLGVFTDAFALHYNYNKEKELITTSAMRKNLYAVWVLGWISLQPLDHVRSYFGDKIGFYFCWLDFYTKMLAPGCVIATIIFLINFVLFWVFPPIRAIEICDEKGPGNLTLCSRCQNCTQEKLYYFCRDAHHGALFDNRSTVALGFCMAVWSFLFLQFWKRIESRLCVAWHVPEGKHSIVKEDIRPQCFKARFHEKLFNDVTGVIEPLQKRIGKVLRSLSSLFILTTLLVCFLSTFVLLLIFRGIVLALCLRMGEDYLRESVPFLISFTSGILILFLIVQYNALSRKVSRFLTNLEMPRTQHEWDTRYIIKLFILSFVTEHSALFYIAYFRGNIAGGPGENTILFGSRFEVAAPEGNMYHLCIVLCIVMIGKCFMRVYVHRNTLSRTTLLLDKHEEDLDRWTKEYSQQPVPDLFFEHSYIDMLSQYGFVAMYAVSFPLAPIIAIIIVIVEIRLSAYGLIVTWRRPLAKPVRGIGIMLQLLKLLSLAAVFSNAVILAFSSELIPQYLYEHYYSARDAGLSYTKFTHSVHYADNASAPCYYRGFYEPHEATEELRPSAVYWHVLAASFSFVFVFVVSAWLVARAITALLFDRTPVERQVQLERNRAQELLIKEDRT